MTSKSMRDPSVELSPDGVVRRDFLRGMGAALGLAGVTACTRAPREEIVPYVTEPADVTPGRRRCYATASTLDGYATGIVVESHEGRPTKVEGNPDHPASLGAAGVFEQALVLGVYDPSRARTPRTSGRTSNWPAFLDALMRGPWSGARGRGLHLLLEPTSSPTVDSLLSRLRERWPESSVHFHAGASRRRVWEGATIAFGAPLEPRFDLSNVDVVVSLDADFLTHDPAHLRLARQLAEGRRLIDRASTMSRLYVVEPLHSVTGMYADHRLSVRAGDVLAIAATLLHSVGAAALPGGIPSVLVERAGRHRRWLDAVARDLTSHRGRAVVIAGDRQPPLVHAIVHALNDVLGASPHVELAPSPIVDAGAEHHDIGGLADALGGGDVDTLLVLGTNAVYTAPADRALASLFGRARMSAYLGLYEDETAHACQWTLPAPHVLESWGDARAFDGTASVVQPLIAPLHDSRSLIDVLAVLAGASSTSAYDLVRERYGRDAWRRALTRGVVDGSRTAAASARPRWSAVAAELRRAADSQPVAELEIVVSPDSRVYDGRFTNNAWLLELPTPIRKLTWTNASTFSPADATRLGLVDGDEVELRLGDRVVLAPALLVPGQASGVVGLTLGWGRAGSEDLARGRGANAYALTTTSAFASGLVVTKSGRRIELPFAQHHHELEPRGASILRHSTLRDHRERSERSTNAVSPMSEESKRRLSLYHVPSGPAPHQWGMAIDLSACTGCSACVIACQAENNVPTVGHEGVRKGRAMHWLRTDTYFIGDPTEPEIAVQPMLCQHCEAAPCEYVCPVGATVHSSDGLNQMVYNRCVGTRFCSNNCPYKVRRFNWFDYHRRESEVEQLVHNPKVTVRERGVMEKCTFCVQRIRASEIYGGPLESACQQTCPTGAIVFGDLQDRSSKVARLHASDRAFAALDELGTLPRVRYLSRIRNPNPELA